MNRLVFTITTLAVILVVTAQAAEEAVIKVTLYDASSYQLSFPIYFLYPY